MIHVLGVDDQDDASTEALRRFWSRAKALPPHGRPGPGPGPSPATTGRVIDLAEWTRARRDPR